METIRCSLSQVKQTDYKDIKELFQNKKVREFLGGIRTETSIEETFIEMLNSVNDSKYWIIRDKESNEFMGLVSLGPHHNGEDVEISYQLIPKWWGKGYATEVINRVIKFAFEVLDINKIVAETQTVNTRSKKLLERVGMELVTTYQRFNEDQSLYAVEQKS